jgi:hypothetical protein
LPVVPAFDVQPGDGPEQGAHREVAVRGQGHGALVFEAGLVAVRVASFPHGDGGRVVHGGCEGLLQVVRGLLDDAVGVDDEVPVDARVGYEFAVLKEGVAFLDFVPVPDVLGTVQGDADAGGVAGFDDGHGLV